MTRLHVASAVACSVLFTLAAKIAAGAPGDRSPDGVWTEVDPALISASERPTFLVPGATPHLLSLDGDALDAILARAPNRFKLGARTSAPVLYLPLPDGGFARFLVFDSPVLSGKLRQERPDVATYSVQGFDDRIATGRLDRIGATFHAMIRSSTGTVFVDPGPSGSASYVCFDRARTAPPAVPFVCQVNGQTIRVKDTLPRNSLREEAGATVQLRTYRLAMVAGGEYTQHFGGILQAQNAIITTVNRLNSVFEIDLAVSLSLTHSLIYPDPETDPFPIANTLERVDSLLDADVGVSNYDIGHMVNCCGAGGAAFPGVVCTDYKGFGATSFHTPQGDVFDIDFVAHEIGHQFGAEHTFNGTSGENCGPNRVPGSAVEPGGGTTIMSYAGICPPEDVEMHADAYFHNWSLHQMGMFISAIATVPGCGVLTITGNDPPAVNAGADRTIPRDTPFTLTASGSDPNGDAVTYCWEEFDLGAPTPPGDPATSPLMRSRLPVTSPARTFPRLSDLFAGTVSPWEALPTADRAIKFRCTARDNWAGAGGTGEDSLVVTVAGDPFRVLAPNGGDVLPAGCPTEIRWQVGGGSIASQVDILLTTNEGATYMTLASSVPNDGSHEVQLACNLNAANARIRINPVGQVFFDISDADFRIQSLPPHIAAGGTDQAVDSSCQAIVPFTAIVTDDCRITATNVNVSVSNPSGNATLGVPVIRKTQISQTEVGVSVEVPVSGLTSCPAIVRLNIDAEDNCGNREGQDVVAAVNDTRAPVAATFAQSGDVDANCSYLLPFGGEVEDNCGILAQDVLVSITNPSANATLGSPTVVKTQLGSGRVRVAGSVLVSDLTGCPAVIQVLLEGHDACGNLGSAACRAEVYDRIPPQIVVSLDREYLWPPNHQLADIVADVRVSDNCPNASFVLTSISSNEPENGLGDGDTAPDIVGAVFGTPDTQFQLRSERAGPRTGRAYTITYTASDHCGNLSSATSQVHVEHDQAGNAVANLNAMSGKGPGHVTVVIPGRSAVAIEDMGDEPALDVAAASGLAGNGSSGSNLDVTWVDPTGAQIGNISGVVDPLGAQRLDVNHDGTSDLVLYYATDAVKALAEATDATTGPVGLHYVMHRGSSFLVPDLFALEATMPVGFTIPALTARAAGPAATSPSLEPVPGGLPTLTAPMEAPGGHVSDPDTISLNASPPSTTGMAEGPPDLAHIRLIGFRPAPMRNATSIYFEVPAPGGSVSLKIYDVRGRLTRTLFARSFTPGGHSAVWDGTNEVGQQTPPGIYLARLASATSQSTLKLIRVR